MEWVGMGGRLSNRVSPRKFWCFQEPTSGLFKQN